MLHGKAPYLSATVKLRDDRRTAAAGSKKTPRFFRIADGCREPDAAWAALRKATETLNQTKGLAATVTAEKRMNFIYHNEAQISKERGNFHVFIDHQRFQ